MAKLNEIINFCNSILNIKAYQDDSLNGLQVEPENQEIESIAISVDSGLSVIKEVQKKQLLIVHHGLYWGKSIPVVGVEGEKIQHLLNNGSALAAYHLPLDGDQKLGNAAQIFKALGINNYEPGFMMAGNVPVGAIARNLDLDRETVLNQLSDISRKYKYQPLHLKSGKTKINSIGICTGAGYYFMDDAIGLNLDLFVTGEPRQSAFHRASENKINVSFIGHYASETFGVLALAKAISEQFSLEYLLIDQPTGI